MSGIASTLSKNVKALRSERGITLQQLADRSGLAKSYVWGIESGKGRNTTIDTALSLASALGVSFGDLTGINPHEPRLHPDAMRIACEIDQLMRKLGTSA